MIEEHQTQSEFYKTLKGYAKENVWLRFDCYLTLDKDGELVIMSPSIYADDKQNNKT